MFPLNAVLFPGTQLPLRVFEQRYRDLVSHLLEIPDPSLRLFGSVAIREGYEIGAHGAQSMYRVGVRLQLSEFEAHPDGSYSIVAVVRDRIRVDSFGTEHGFPMATVSARPSFDDPIDDRVIEYGLATFATYREALAELRSDPYDGALPRDPEYLTWSLAAAVPLPLAERQTLLESDTASERLALVVDHLRDEIAAISVVASLPATDVARNKWSPN